MGRYGSIVLALVGFYMRGTDSFIPSRSRGLAVGQTRRLLRPQQLRTTTTKMTASQGQGPIPAGSVVAVIGGTGGLGTEIVKGFVSSGCETYPTVRGSKTEGLEEANPAGIITGVDMTDEECGYKVDKGLPEGKTLDILFIVAGYFTTETFDDLHFDEQRKMMEICAFGPLRTVQQLVKTGRIKEGTKVAMITSEGGSIGLRTEEEGGANYGHHMSKCAQNMMGKILSLDLKPRGIPVVMLHPGFLKTEMTKHYAEMYEKFGAVTPAEAVEPLLQAVARLKIDNTGKFIAPMGSKGLGLGQNALPNSYLEPFGELPW